MFQRFAGKTVSFSIAVPAARLYTCMVFHTIGSFAKHPHKTLKIVGELREEIAYWRFLSTWTGHLPWFDKRQLLLQFFVYASNSGWGGVVFAKTTTLSHYATIGGPMIFPRQ